jgi:hypothetical protein
MEEEKIAQGIMLMIVVCCECGKIHAIVDENYLDDFQPFECECGAKYEDANDWYLINKVYIRHRPSNEGEF